MALSPKERDILLQIERQLHDDDPELAARLSRRRRLLSPSTWAVGLLAAAVTLTAALLTSAGIGVADTTATSAGLGRGIPAWGRSPPVPCSVVMARAGPRPEPLSWRGVSPGRRRGGSRR